MSGALVGGVLAIGLALFQFWGDWIWIVAVWAIFQSGQFVEGNILTPKLVGDSVGLHPVWLIFALSAFGALFGFVGLLVAVPVAAVLGRAGALRHRAVPAKPPLQRARPWSPDRATPRQLTLDLRDRAPALGREAFFVAPATARRWP